MFARDFAGNPLDFLGIAPGFVGLLRIYRHISGTLGISWGFLGIPQAGNMFLKSGNPMQESRFLNFTDWGTFGADPNPL